MPVDSLRLRQPKVQYVQLETDGYDGDNIVFQRNIERQTNLMVIGMVVKERAALTTHFLCNLDTPGLRHNNYDAISGNTLDSTSGIPLGLVACAPSFLATTTGLSVREGFYPWPGRMNDVQRLSLLAIGMAKEDPRQAEVQQRLALALSMPCTPYPCTVWPLEGGKQFQMTLRRIAGAADLTKVWLVCVKLPDDIFRNACQFAELPQWCTQLVNIPETAGTSAPINLQCNSKDGYGFLFTQLFTPPYSQNPLDDTDIAFDITVAEETSLHLQYENQEIYDGVAQYPMPLSMQCPNFLSDFDCGRKIDILMNPRSQLVLNMVRDSVLLVKRWIPVTAYGLVAQAEAGLLQAQGPSILL